MRPVLEKRRGIVRRAWSLAAALGLAGALAAAEAPELQKVTVKPGDTLWGLANRYLKDPKRWPDVLKHNKLPSSDPTVTLPGMTLLVPVALIKEELRAAQLVYRLNKVLFRRQETAGWKDAANDMDLFRDDALRTLQDSKARVRFLGEDLLQLDPNSMAIIKPVGKDYDVELKSAGVYVGKAKILTASAKITPKTGDTRYAATVREDLSTTVEVYTGKADVESEGASVEVPAGMASVIKLGLAPSLPKKIPDLPDFRERLPQFPGDIRATVAKSIMAAPAGRNLKVSAGLEDVKVEVDMLSVGEPISGFRLQISDVRDFGRLLYNRAYDVDAEVKVADFGLTPGRYYVRVAVIDLLGTQGRFAAPRLFQLSAKSLRRIPE